MLDTYSSRNHHDFKQRYQGTIGFLVQGDKKRLVYLSHVDDGSAKFQDVHGHNYYVYSDGEQVFEFIQVNRGWFNTTTDLYYITRVPTRQWKRGICADNTQIYLCGPKGFNRVDVTVKTLATIFDNSITPAVALKEFKGGTRWTAALSKHFAITKGVFYFNNKLWGTVKETKDNIAITLDDTLIYQELSDVLRRNNFEGITLSIKEQNGADTSKETS